MIRMIAILQQRIIASVAFFVTLACPFTAAYAQCIDWSASFGIPGNGINGVVHALKVVQTPQGERLYAAGQFTQAGSVAAVNVASWDGTTWSPVGAWPFSGTIRALEVFDDGTGPAVYAGGTFQNASAANLVKWNGSQWVSVGGGVNGDVHVLRSYSYQGQPALFVGGRFSAVGGEPSESIAALTSTGWKRWFAAPDFSSHSNVAYDPFRDHVVIIGTTSTASSDALCETWTWDGSVWSKSPSTGPIKRLGTSFAFDSLRNRLLMMGGTFGAGGESANTLWAWNGIQWSVVSVAPSGLVAKGGYGLAYDSARDRLVVFGGAGTGGTLSAQTWEFDGTTWSQALPALSPSARYGHALAYDPVRQRTVLFGGSSTVVAESAETWEWDGVNWQQIAVTGPLGRQYALLAYNPATSSIILSGGIGVSGGGNRADVWSWNGTTWSQVAPISNYQGRDQFQALDTSRQRLVSGAIEFTRALNGTDWQPVFQGGLGGLPNPQTCSSLAVHFDGVNEFLYAGGDFTRASGQPSGASARLVGPLWLPAGTSAPFPMAVFSVATGPQAGLWGSGNFGTPSNLARWQSGDWQPFVPADGSGAGGFRFSADFGEGERICAIGSYSLGWTTTGTGLITLGDSGWKGIGYREPRARSYVAMTYDSVRKETVLFGGTSNLSASGALGDTETFNGRTWTTRPGPGPSARFKHAMAFDEARGVAVLAGGVGLNGVANGETWTWNGATWSLAAPSIGGEARSGHAMAYDPIRQRVVLFGGKIAAGTSTNATWEWDGSTWTQVSTIGPSPRDQHAMAFDPTRGVVVMIGGLSASGTDIQETWTWDGTTWTQLPTNVFGGGRGSLVFDKVTQRLEYSAFTSLWTLSPFNQWTNVTSSASLPNAASRSVAFDTTLNTPVYFGGHRIEGSETEIYASTRTRLPNLQSPIAQVGSTLAYAAFGSGAARRHFVAASLADQTSRGVSVYGDACIAPTFTQHPTSRVAIYNSSVSFSAIATGTQPITYQWRRNGIPVVNIQGTISGAQSSTLQFGNAWSFADAGTYDCVATNPHGQAISNSAQFTVENVGPNGPVFLTKIIYAPQSLTTNPEIVIGRLFPALLANNGRAGFMAERPSGGRLIAAWRNQVSSPVAVNNDYAPGIEQFVRFATVEPVDISLNTGGILYKGSLSGDLDPGFSKGLWYDAENGSALVARHGYEAVGTDAVFGTNEFLSAVNAQGTVAFSASLAGGSTTNTNALGLWTWRPTQGLSLAMRTGSPAPGVAGTITHIDAFEIADDGNLAVLARANGIQGYWLGPLGSLSRRASIGDGAPGFPANTAISSFAGLFTTTPNNVMYFAADVINSTSTFKALYKSNPLGLALLVKSGQAAPGLPNGSTLTNPRPIAANTAGQVLFSSDIACASCGTTSGIFIYQPSGIVQLVMRTTGTPPPGTSAYFTSATATSVAAITELGQVIISGSVSNGTVSGPAVFGWTQTSGTFTVLAPGHQVQIDPGQYRTVTGATVYSPVSVGAGTARTKSLNTAGQVAVLATFSDQTSGLFIGTFGQFLTGLFPCPTFAVPVGSTEERLGRTVTLSAEVAGTPPFTYRWLKDGVPLADGGRISGATSTHLVISALANDDAGTYLLEARNACPDTVTSSAALTVLCPADLDDGSATGHSDGAVTIDDLLFFLVAFEAGTDFADVDNGLGFGEPDGAVTIDDLLFFLVRFEAGC